MKSKQVSVRKERHTLSGFVVKVKLPTQYRTILIRNQPYYLKFTKPEFRIKIFRELDGFRVGSLRLQLNGKTPPLPNTTRSGQVCLGRRIRGKSLVKVAQIAIERFWSTRFHSKNKNSSAFEKWKKSSLKGKTARPKPIDWTPLEKYSSKLKEGSCDVKLEVVPTGGLLLQMLTRR